MSDEVELQRGDNDKKKIWAGKRQDTAPNYNVRKLQSDLKKVGVYTSKVDGDYGKLTEKAIRIFQWCQLNSRQVIKDKKLTDFTPHTAQAINGRCDAQTASRLAQWVDAGFQVSGDLVRVDTSQLNRISLGPGFKHIGKPQVTKTDLVISREALSMLELMNKAATSLGLTIVVNQVLRLNNVKVSGAVVPPATKSQHLIGHAIDCNIVDGNKWNSSRDFKNNRQTAKAEKFIDRMKRGGHRWGGDFSRVDTPHFDRKLDSSTFGYDAKFFLNQKQIASGDPIEGQSLAD